MTNEINNLFELIEKNQLNNIKGIIFDCFGTLVEIKEKTNPYKFLLSELKKLELNEKNVNFLKDYKKWVMSKNFDWLTLESELGIEVELETKQIFKRLLQKELHSIEYFQDTLKTLNFLINNNVKVIVCSNLASQYAEQITLLFKMCGLDKVHLIFSSDVGYIKPEKEIYEKCESFLEEQKNNILFIGDSYQNDYIEPKNYGFKAIWLNRK